jgi:hypothetical protein
MAWVVHLDEVVDDVVTSSHVVKRIDRPERIEELEQLGLKLTEAKTILGGVQRVLVARQVEIDGTADVRGMRPAAPHQGLPASAIRHPVRPCRCVGRSAHLSAMQGYRGRH